jgi:hypothetical protein
MSAADAAQRLKEDVSNLLESGRTAAREYGSAGAAFRRLFFSDFALARIALVRGLVFLLIATLMGVTAYATAMVMLVIALRSFGAPWLLALSVPLVASAAVAWHAWKTARRALAFADLDATRRQLAAWFTPTQPISTPSPTGTINPGPPDPDQGKSTVSPEHP